MASALTGVSSDQLLPGQLYVTYESIILNPITMYEPYRSDDISCNKVIF